LGTLFGGCNLLTPAAVLMDAPTKTVPAEFARLPGHRVAVVVWAKPATLAVFPFARYDTANHVCAKLRSMVPGLTMISASRVEEYLEQSSDMVVDPVEVGRHFGAEMVVFLELLTFQTRDPRTPQLVQGKITSSVVVYDLTDGDGTPRRYELSTASVTIPEDKPVGVMAADERRVRKETCEAFGEAVARKFVKHKVEL
jgi:hypothetical protein